MSIIRNPFQLPGMQPEEVEGKGKIRIKIEFDVEVEGRAKTPKVRGVLPCAQKFHPEPIM